jgi:hypothetical protein
MVETGMWEVMVMETDLILDFRYFIKQENQAQGINFEKQNQIR